MGKQNLKETIIQEIEWVSEKSWLTEMVAENMIERLRVAFNAGANFKEKFYISNQLPNSDISIKEPSFEEFLKTFEQEEIQPGDFVSYDPAMANKLQRVYDGLIAENAKLSTRIDKCHHYLMGVNPEDLSVEDALVELGFNSSGYLEADNF